jgi:hypothetical protein
VGGIIKILDTISSVSKVLFFNQRYFRITGIAIILLLFAGSYVGYAADENEIQNDQWIETRITGESEYAVYPKYAGNPEMSGDKIVWVEYRNVPSEPVEILMYNISTGIKTPIFSDYERSSCYPQISGNWIIWWVYDSSYEEYEIYGYDISSGNVIKTGIYTVDGDLSSVDFLGNIIVYVDYIDGDSGLYMYDLSSKTEIPIVVPGHESVRFPSILNNNIFWIEAAGYYDSRYHYNLRRYNISTGIQTTAVHDITNGDLATNGDIILWNVEQDDHYYCHIYNISTGIETQLQYEDGPASFEYVIKDRVFWNEDGNWMEFNLSSGITSQSTIFSPSDTIYEIKYSGNKMIWIADYILYMYDFEKESKYIVSTHASFFPRISDYGVVWMDDIYTEGYGDIFLAKFNEASSPVSDSEILKMLIQSETEDEFIVTVDAEEEYKIATLSHYINPVNFELSETEDEVKVYLDMEGYPVSDLEIARKIGVIDYINKLQKNGLKGQLEQKQEDVLFKAEVTSNLILTDELVSLGAQSLDLSTLLGAASIKATIELLYQEIITSVSADYILSDFTTREDMRDVATNNYYEANDAYYAAWYEIRDENEASDYHAANIVLNNYLTGELLTELGDHINANLDKGRDDFVTLVCIELYNLKSFGTIESVMVSALALDYDLVSFQKRGISQCDISKKPYEATSYTLKLAGSDSALNEYQDCVSRVYATSEEMSQAVVDYFTNDFMFGVLNSPGELRVYDSQNRVTGLIDGQIVEEIPNSAYISEDETIIIYNAIDTYRYEVEGTDFGTYGLDLISFNNWDTVIAFDAIDIPTTPDQNHQYNVYWETLPNDKNGVSIQIDSDGDGVFDKVVYSGNQLTAADLISNSSETNVPEFSTIALPVATILGLAFLFQRRNH